jgi:hypothetical protein
VQNKTRIDTKAPPKQHYDKKMKKKMFIIAFKRFVNSRRLQPSAKTEAHLYGESTHFAKSRRGQKFQLGLDGTSG